MDCTFTPVSMVDVDEFTAWETDLGWDIESTQLTAGSNAIGFDHLAFPGLMVGHFHGRQSMYNVFELPAGMVMTLLARESTALTWNGIELPPRLMGFVHPGRNQWARLPDGWDCYELMLDEELVRRTEILPPAWFERSGRADHPVLPVVEAVAQRLMDGLDRIFREVRAAGVRRVAPEDGTAYYEFILEGLRRLVDEGLAAKDGQAPRATRRADLVEQAREYMGHHVQAGLTIDAIADALGVSYRVLNYAFQDALGVSPYRYYLTERLHAVRRTLRTGDASVTQACTAHGFGTPGRFTMQYKRLFGELPSETAAVRGNGNGNGRRSTAG